MTYNHLPIYLECISVYECLSNVLTSQVDVFDDFRHDVLALGQLKDVLLAIDDLQGAVGQPLADVTLIVI